MRTDWQVADEIFKDLDCDICCGPMHSQAMMIFRKHLTAYADERVKEALEEAAEIAEFHSGPSIQLAEKIRALKDYK